MLERKRQRFCGPMELCIEPGCENPRARHYIRSETDQGTGANRRCSTHIDRRRKARLGALTIPLDAPVWKGSGRPATTRCVGCGGERAPGVKHARCRPCLRVYWRQCQRDSAFLRRVERLMGGV